MERHDITKIDFLLYSPQKTGSTSLAAMLNMHKQISAINVPSKEPHFFNHPKITHEQVLEYNNKFAQDDTLKFEKSTAYFSSPTAINNIKLLCKDDIKFITVLRNPVTRFISLYKFFRSISYIHESGLSDEAQRIAGFKIPNDPVFFDFPKIDELLARDAYEWTTRAGLYHTHLERLYSLFKPSSILVFTYDDFKANAKEVLISILNFLQVDCDLTDIKLNIKWNSFNTWDTLLNKLNLKELDIDIPEKYLAQIKEYYHEPNKLLNDNYGIINNWNE